MYVYVPKNDRVVSIFSENDGKHFVEKVFKFIVFALKHISNKHYKSKHYKIKQKLSKII